MNKYVKLVAVVLPTVVALAVTLDQTGAVRALIESACAPVKTLPPAVVEVPDGGV